MLMKIAEFKLDKALKAKEKAAQASLKADQGMKDTVTSISVASASLRAQADDLDRLVVANS